MCDNPWTLSSVDSQLVDTISIALGFKTTCCPAEPSHPGWLFRSSSVLVRRWWFSFAYWLCWRNSEQQHLWRHSRRVPSGCASLLPSSRHVQPSSCGKWSWRHCLGLLWQLRDKDTSYHNSRQGTSSAVPRFLSQASRLRGPCFFPSENAYNKHESVRCAKNMLNVLYE